MSTEPKPSAWALRAAHAIGEHIAKWKQEGLAWHYVDFVEIIDRETGAGEMAASLSDAWTIINVLHMAQMDQAEVWPRALEWLQANEKYKP